MRLDWQPWPVAGQVAASRLATLAGQGTTGDRINDHDSNWLPAPEGNVNLSLRLYWPKENVIRGRWMPPPVVRGR
jgi:hypothetical protein